MCPLLCHQFSHKLDDASKVVGSPGDYVAAFGRFGLEDCDLDVVDCHPRVRHALQSLGRAVELCERDDRERERSSQETQKSDAQRRGRHARRCSMERALVRRGGPARRHSWHATAHPVFGSCSITASRQGTASTRDSQDALAFGQRAEQQARPTVNRATRNVVAFVYPGPCVTDASPILSWLNRA
jgi:hypothetical protein